MRFGMAEVDGHVAEESLSRRRPHSVKVPRLYKAAAKLLDEHRKSGRGVKSLVYGVDSRGRPPHPNAKALLSLLSCCVRRRRRLDRVLAISGMESGEPGFDPSLARVLVAEMLFGKGAPPGGDSKPARTVAKYEQRLRAALAQDEEDEDEPTISNPRYARVNIVKATVSKVIFALRSEGFRQAQLDDTTTLKEFSVKISNLEKDEFVRDPVVDNLLVFSAGTSDWHDHRLYQEGKLLLQDRASCLPVSALEPPVGATALDACAAPGMKTTQLAAAVGATGKVYAVEKDSRRCVTLREMITYAGVDTITEILNSDFLHIDPENYPDVEYIVLDPSCSGLGTMQESADVDKKRLESLSWIQSKLLQHALTFPNVKRVTYSTCSIAKEENEMVVEKVLSALDASSPFRLKKCLPQWERRGLPDFAFSDKVVRCDPVKDLCNGFFVAMFQRKERKRKRPNMEEAACFKKKQH